MARPKITAPKGVYDVCDPGHSDRWNQLERTFFELAALYAYPRLSFPLIEHTDLFVRSVGEATDIVDKQMYTFADRAGRSLTLRPEGTAGVVRAFVEHHLDQAGLPWKAAYFGPMFRAENVQRGRYRQFFQFGLEAIGVDDPDLDVEVVELGWRFLETLGLRDVTLEVNTLGGLAERRGYVEELRRFVSEAVPNLGEDDRRRFDLNPLRLLDSKEPDLARALEDAPQLVDFLGEATRERFARVCAGLDAAGIPYVANPYLVRGLDYYTATTFEYRSSALEAAQDALGGGGHYDGLVELVGGPPLPGIGFGLGVERILLAADAEEVVPPAAGTVDVVVVQAGETRGDVVVLTRELREAGVRADGSYGDRSVKAQLRHADRLNAALAAIVGERDLAEGVVTVRDMGTGDEQKLPREEVAKRIAEDMER